MIGEVNEECGTVDTASSSDDDDFSYNMSTKCQNKQMMKIHGVFEFDLGHVQDTFALRSMSQPLSSMGLPPDCSLAG